jgi:hypothetical protein
MVYHTLPGSVITRKPIFDFFKGSNINFRILLPLKKAKSGQNNPENRRTLSFATTSSNCSIPVVVVTGVYICWGKGFGTTEHFIGKADDFAETVDSALRKAGSVWREFSRWTGIK